jgi:flagellar biosynthesis protein FlhF
MRLKVYPAKNVQAAMADIRGELGPDAIIVATEKVKDGVLVTAAIERPLPAPERAQAEPPAALPSGKGRTVIAKADLGRIVQFHRLTESLSRDLLRAAGAMEGEEGLFPLSHALDALFSFRPLAVAPETPLLLVGPPGSGKSTAAARIAARAVLDGHDCLLISTDAVRAGASAQLSGFAERLGQPHTVAADGAELAALVEEAGDERIVLIDSLGVNPYRAEDRALLKDLIGRSDIEPILVLPAGLDAEEAADAASALKEVGIRRLLGTRLDMGRRLGGLLSAAHAAGLAFSDIASSPYIGEGLDPLHPATLARLMAHCAGVKTKTANRREAAR